MALGFGGFLNDRRARWPYPLQKRARGPQPSLTVESTHPYDPRMPPIRPTGDPSLVVRAAVRVGEVLGHWRRRRLTAAQDAYIEKWKAAWSEGSDAGWHGVSQDAVPYRHGPQRDAWSAGWHWANTHPDRRDSDGTALTFQDRHLIVTTHPRAIGPAGGGAIGVAFVAAARWLLRSRQRPRPGAGPPPQQPA